MSVKVTYTCDRCGDSTEDGSQQWRIGVVAKPLNASMTNEDVATDKYRLHVCRKCCEQFGLIPQVVTRGTEFVPPSLESMIREIVRAEIDERI